MKILKPLQGKISKKSSAKAGSSSIQNISENEFSYSLKSVFLRRTKIQSRFMLSFLGLSIIPLVCFGFLAASMSGNAVVSKIESYSNELLRSTVAYVDVETSRVLEINKEVILSDLIQKDMKIMGQMSDAEKNQTSKAIERFILNKFLKDEKVICSIIMGEDNRAFKYGSTSVLSNEEWDNIKQKVIEFGGGTRETDIDEDNSEEKAIEISAGAKDVLTFCMGKKLENQNAIIYANNIIDTLTGKHLGVMITLIDEAYLTEAYKDLNIAEGSHAYIINNDGTIISSLKPEEIDTVIPDNTLVTKIVAASAENDSFHVEERMIASKQLSPSGWHLVAEIPYSYLYKESNSIRNFVIVFIIAVFILSLVLAWLITKSIIHPLKKLVSVMKKAEEGDLTLRVLDNNKDEVAMLFESFNQMLANIKLLVNKVRESAKQVLEGAANVSVSSSQSFTFSQQISSAIQQIAEGSTNQAADTVESVRHMENLSSDIHEVEEIVEDVSESLDKTKSMSEDVQKHIVLLNEKALETSDITEKVVGDILELNIDMKEIGKITNMIASVSEQTNLLSLNAAIEAARAGEAGRGFAVVADEVKKLSDQSSEASRAISDLVEKIQNKAQTTANQASGAARIVGEQTTAVQTANKSFDEIFSHMENIFSLMQRMSQCVDKMMASREKASLSMQNVSAVSEEFAATSEEVSASTEEQISSIEKLSELAQQINSLAIGLDHMIANFKVE
ncbi:MAG: methyl-accepting chemotaxis protein [Acetivibrionales bacterium]